VNFLLLYNRRISRRCRKHHGDAELRRDLRQNAAIDAAGRIAMSHQIPVIPSPLLRTAVVLLLALGTGCGSLAKHSENESLSTTLLAYANIVRWGDFEQALTFVDAQSLKDHPLSSIDMERYKQVKVASYNEQPPVPAGPHEVRQTVEIGIVNINTQIERNIIDKQLWRYDEQKKHWHLVSGLPDITQH
jgi:hypothetical protein